MIPLFPTRPFLFLARQRAVLRGRPRTRIALLVLALLSIVIWQGTFRDNTASLETDHKLEDGVFGSRQGEFVYFYHFLDLYPVSALENPRPAPNHEAAREALRERASELSLGEPYDRMSVALYLPDVLLGGDPYAPRQNTAAWLGFVFALCCLYTAFWSARLEFMGLAAVALLGSDPFQLYEVYVRNNIFGWTITIGLLVLAINLPLFMNHRYYLKSRGWISAYMWLAPLVSGLLLGVFRHVRTESISAIAAALATYLFLRHVPLRRKGMMILVLLVSFMAAKTSVNDYFNRVEAHTSKIVMSSGGQAAGNRGGQKVHVFWHSFWGGLGDFDDRYGYLFWDRVITDYGQTRTPDIPVFGSAEHIRYTDAYASVLRDKVIHDVLADPMWLARIIVKRLERGFVENTPPQIAIGNRHWTFPLLPGLLLPFGIFALISHLVRRETGIPVMFLYPLSIGAIAIALTSDMGFHYYIIIHLFLYVLVFAWLLEAVLRLADSRRRIPGASSSPQHTQPPTNPGVPT